LFGHAIASKLTIYLSRYCHWIDGTRFAMWWLSGCNSRAGKDMKIYLLMMLIGSILTAVHFTSAPEPQPKTPPQ
jgi:hypothetical protein